MHFIDVAEITAIAGKGGDGAVAFRREAGVPRGGPNGGNGGRGGSIWLVASSLSSTLQDFRYRRSYKASPGQMGGGWNKTGSDGESHEVPVPCGTLVYDADTNEVICDLTAPGQRFCVAAGGKGGRGNYEFRSPHRQTPFVATPGRPGETRHLRLELKLLADIGLIGLPNAGKSTLLSRLTAARPKIADYPFTTLVPNLGIVDLGDFVSCTLADIPGLIEGAAEGAGLGHQFLRHLARTRLLLHLVDLAPMYEGVDPVHEAHAILNELKKYDEDLFNKPRWLVLNKLDLLQEEERAEKVAAFLKAFGGDTRYFTISAINGEGCKELTYAIMEHINQIAEQEQDAVTESAQESEIDIHDPLA
ncbi:MAG: GTPase ObgE [Sideroxyarcus sp.]|nr:GTPase ObgE [Sideroxyarcus sp.]